MGLSGIVGLERFIEAQKNRYDIALKEVKQGYKKSCWMWFIFPQMKGLGNSIMSNYYGIVSYDEAKDYLKNDYLSHNLYEITNELLKQDNSVEVIFGEVDTRKLKSSMTLFYVVSKDELFKKVIDKFYGGELDQNTINLLNGRKLNGN